MIELVLLTLGFIAASGFFAMIDAAILNVSPAETEVMVTKGKWGAKELKKLQLRLTRAIIIVVMFTNVTNILGPILVGRKAEALYGSDIIGVITAILTFATILCSEIIPKSVGAHYAPEISRFAAPFLRFFIIVLYPIVVTFEYIAKFFKSGKRKIGTEDQIRALANLGRGAGHIDSDERELIHRAFVLNDRTVSDIMTPTTSIVSIHKGKTIRHAAKMIFEHTYSRYLVIGQSLDEVLGYIISHDALEMLADGKDDHAITDIIRPILSVDASLKCDDLLNVLRKNDAHVAVVKTNGKTVGLVTMEDVLEELVGEIQDEGDMET